MRGSIINMYTYVNIYLRGIKSFELEMLRQPPKRVSTSLFPTFHAGKMTKLLDITCLFIFYTRSSINYALNKCLSSEKLIVKGRHTHS